MEAPKKHQLKTIKARGFFFPKGENQKHPITQSWVTWEKMQLLQ